eukprot:g4214.t1
MLCSISGQVPQTPVVSVKSGLIFEKRLIEHEIEEHGLCPKTQEPLSLSDLVEIKLDKVAKPRPSAGTSIPGLLSIFHNEWDALMLESHSLRQNLTAARQELSQALYQHDAACRVIARLIKERDTARDVLTQLHEPMSRNSDEEHPSKKQSIGITPEICDLLITMSETMKESRTNEGLGDEVVDPESLKEYTLLTSQPLHATKQGGILSLASHPSSRKLLATGGEDCTIKIFDKSSRTLVASIEEHFKRIYELQWTVEGFLVSCSADKSVRVWIEEEDIGEMKCGLNLRHHDDEVTAVTSTIQRFLISASFDCSLGFIDLELGKCIERMMTPLVDCGYTSVKMHPDGLVLSSGTEAGDVHLWDLTQQRIVKSLVSNDSGHESKITGLGFHRNGIHMASASNEVVKLWDVRKMEVFKDLDLESSSSLAYDYEGRYLAIGGDKEIKILDSLKDYEEVAKFKDFPGAVKCVEFGENSTNIIAGSTDHNLRMFGHD